MTFEEDNAEILDIDCGESPFYTEFLYKIQEDNPNFGLASINWDSSLTNLLANKNKIIEEFNSYYGLKEIGDETEQRFMFNLQRKYNQIKDEYDYRFGLYAKYDLSKISEDRVYEMDTSSKGNTKGQRNDNSTNLGYDTPATPITELNNGFLTGGTVTKSGSNDVSSVDRKSNVKETTKGFSENPMERIDRNYKLYHDIICDFVKEFKTLFINKLARV